jgi:rhodanese-related sulfurtransferase
MQQLDPASLAVKIAENSVHLLDVREPFEHATENLGGLLIPLGELGKRWAEIPLDKPIVVYCKKGIRSIIAIQKLQDRLPQVTWLNLAGGIEAWKKSLP